MNTGIVVVPSAKHTRTGHPESADRLTAVIDLLDERGALAGLTPLDPVPASRTQLVRAHSPAMIEAIETAVRNGRSHLDADTYITPASFDAARLAAGASAAAADAILSGEVRNGLALVRPPGHHAERGRPGGFCLFNNAAVAARQAQAVHGAGRIMIVDFDVHHGNGTQDIFYDDDSVLFTSIHLYGRFFYPGTGASQEVGQGRGYGYTVNVPLPSNVGDRGYRRIFQEILLPKAGAFKPDFIIVSAGFDAHWRDPLAYGGLSLAGYARLTRDLINLAGELCGGRILFILEGGYLRQALAYGVLNLVRALNGRDLVEDPIGPAPDGESNVTNLLFELQLLHLIN